MANLWEEHLFWYDPKTYELHYEKLSDSSFMYTRVTQLCQERDSTINCWNLTQTGWYTSAMNGGSSPYKTNLHKVIADNVPADIKTLCLLLSINWR